VDADVGSKMCAVKVVSLDMEGTLIDHAFSHAIWETDIPYLYAEKHRLDLGSARERVLAEYNTVGDRRREWYDVDYWFRRLGLEADWRQLIRERADLIKVYPDAAEALERLSGVYPMIVSSNTIREFLDLQVDAVGHYFTHVYSAPSDFGTVKKDADFYRLIIGSLGVRPCEMVHVGDHLEFDYRAARSLGVRAYHLDRSNETAELDTIHDLVELADLLIDS
jgi:HAD superfamily hydrolase (TIGR01549 family)